MHLDSALLGSIHILFPMLHVEIRLVLAQMLQFGFTPQLLPRRMVRTILT